MYVCMYVRTYVLYDYMRCPVFLNVLSGNPNSVWPEPKSRSTSLLQFSIHFAWQQQATEVEIEGM